MKKFFVVLMVVAMSIAPVFAGDLAIEGDNGFTISSIGKIVTLATGLVPGALIAIKFMVDVVSAYYHREQDPSKLQKAIVNFISGVLIVVGYSVVVQVLCTVDATGDSDNDRSAFLSGLTTSGAEVPAGIQAPGAFGFDLSGFELENAEALLD